MAYSHDFFNGGGGGGGSKREREEGRGSVENSCIRMVFFLHIKCNCRVGYRPIHCKNCGVNGCT